MVAELLGFGAQITECGVEVGKLFLHFGDNLKNGADVLIIYAAYRQVVMVPSTSAFSAYKYKSPPAEIPGAKVFLDTVASLFAQILDGVFVCLVLKGAHPCGKQEGKGNQDKCRVAHAPTCRVHDAGDACSDEAKNDHCCNAKNQEPFRDKTDRRVHHGQYSLMRRLVPSVVHCHHDDGFG